MFNTVDKSIYNLYDQFVVDRPAFAIDPFLYEDDNINCPIMKELVVLILTNNYFGKFFPAIFTSVTCSEDFIRQDSGKQTSELYTTNVS